MNWSGKDMERVKGVGKNLISIYCMNSIFNKNLKVFKTMLHIVDVAVAEYLLDTVRGGIRFSFQPKQ